MFYKQLTNTVWLIPGENQSPFTLAGTNVFVIGKGKKRSLIDAGEFRNLKFIRNVKKFILDQEIEIENIFVTHSHTDHVGGSCDIVLLLQDLGQKYQPKIYMKYMNTTYFERTYEYYPLIENLIVNVSDGDVFQLDNSSLKVIETPGHYWDHLCFLYEVPNEESILFTGDHILGNKAPTYNDYYQYMESLYKLRDMKNLQKLCVAHSLDLEKDSIMLDAKTKIQDVITFREEKDERMLNQLKEDEKITLDELYERLYGKQYKKSKSQHFFKWLLSLQLDKYIKEQVVIKDGDYYERAKL